MLTDAEKLMILFDILGVDYHFSGGWLVAARRNFHVDEDGCIDSVKELVTPKKI